MPLANFKIILQLSYILFLSYYLFGVVAAVSPLRSRHHQTSPFATKDIAMGKTCCYRPSPNNSNYQHVRKLAESDSSSSIINTTVTEVHTNGSSMWCQTVWWNGDGKKITELELGLIFIVCCNVAWLLSTHRS